MPKISVVIPVFNTEKYLENCIVSILNQTINDYEIILVDDGSTDNCAFICDEYASQYEFINAIHTDNYGVSHARNVGIKNATGEYVTFVDSDDVLHFQALELLLKATQNVDVAYCDYQMFCDNIDFNEISNEEISTFCGDNRFSNASLCYYTMCNKLIKKTLLDDLRFDENLSYAEDSKLAFELVKNAHSCAFVNHKLYGYRKRENSSIASIDINGLKAIISVWNNIYEYGVQNKNNLIIKSAKAMLVHTYINLFYKSKEVDSLIYQNSKKYLQKNICVAFNNKLELSIKEKIALLINLL